MKNLKLLSGALASVLAPLTLQGAILSKVPMQGGMVMEMVAYHADDGRLHVTRPAGVPQLTPLLVSNPNDGFDPADPWFDKLDPSRQGASFSRRYGFVMDAMSDPLPAETQMWIRKLSGPADLQFYRYSGSAPKVFDPIFGAEATTNALSWDGVMFHPVAAVPPGTNGCTATFEVYLLDSASGQEVPGSGSGPLVFSWTNLPDGRPALSLALTQAQSIVIGWPAGTAAGWVLECASSVDASTWTTVTNTPVLVDGRPAVMLDAAALQHYYRMRYVR